MFNINNVIKEKTVHIREQEIIRTNIGKNETRIDRMKNGKYRNKTHSH